VKPTRTSLHFGRTLRRLRADAGITQAQLSKRSRISQEHLSLMERGHRLPAYPTLRALAATFGQKAVWELLLL